MDFDFLFHTISQQVSLSRIAVVDITKIRLDLISRWRPNQNHSDPPTPQSNRMQNTNWNCLILNEILLFFVSNHFAGLICVEEIIQQMYAIAVQQVIWKYDRWMPIVFGRRGGTLCFSLIYTYTHRNSDQTQINLQLKKNSCTFFLYMCIYQNIIIYKFSSSCTLSLFILYTVLHTLPQMCIKS